MSLKSALSCFAFACLGLSGCAQTTLYSGLPPGDAPRGYDSRWHTAYFFGLIEGGGPYDLDRLCPGGWSEISVSPDFFSAVAGAVTLFIYAPNRLTIVCAREPEPGTPRSQAGYPPHPTLPR